MDTTNTAAIFTARLAAWETAWGAYIESDRSADAWFALDAACVAIGETNPIKPPAAFWSHRKPNAAGPCAICGCASKSLRTAKHARTMPRDRAAAAYTKLVTVPFGNDGEWVAI